MSNIQLFQNTHTADIFQMMWDGQVTVGDIQDALHKLRESVHALTHPTNLIVIVAPDTQLPSFDNLQHLSYTIHNKHLTGWMVIGNNCQANATITRLLAESIPTNHT